MEIWMMNRPDSADMESGTDSYTDPDMEEDSVDTADDSSDDID